jgi:hypothetical protein
VDEPAEEAVADGSEVTRWSVGVPGASAMGTSGDSIVLAQAVWTVHESSASPDVMMVWRKSQSVELRARIDV